MFPFVSYLGHEVIFGNRTVTMTLRNKEYIDNDCVHLAFLLCGFFFNFLSFKEKKYKLKMSIEKNAREEQVCAHTSF